MFPPEKTVTLNSDVCMLHKSNGINSDAATWVDGPIEGDYERVEAPDNWRDLIAEADECTAGCQPDQTEIGEESDWEWYSFCEADDQGYYTGIEWLAARYVGE
jgi:hypothetical protein